MGVQSTKLAIVTYNIYFSDHKIIQRTTNLCDYLLLLSPNVICLQEINRKSLAIIYQKLNKTYEIFCPELKRDNYATGILVKKNCRVIYNKRIPYENSFQDRDIACVGFVINNEKYLVINTHFESIFNDMNYAKYEQFKNVDEFINQHKNTWENIFLCCDSNIQTNSNPISRDELEFAAYFDSMIDSWVCDGENPDKCFTYDYNSNYHLWIQNIKIISRLDRLLYLSNKQQTNFVLLKRENTHAYSKEEYSDHFGIMVEFKI